MTLQEYDKPSEWSSGIIQLSIPDEDGAAVSIPYREGVALSIPHGILCTKGQVRHCFLYNAFGDNKSTHL